MPPLVHSALRQRFPPRSRRNKWRRVAKKLARPQTALWAAPALLLPLVAMVLISEDSGPSPIEQTVASLPVPVDLSNPAGTLADSSPFGSGSARLTSTTMPIYNTSALVLSTQMQVMNANRWYEPEQPVEILDRMDYAQLHPRERSQDDLLVGEVKGLLTMPLSADLGIKLFREYCAAQPDDPFYDTDVNDLPIDKDLLASLQQLALFAPNSGFCPRVSDD